MSPEAGESPITEALKFHQREGTLRNLQPAKSGLIDFASNDYLGLSKNQFIRDSLIRALHLQCPLGATGSRLVTGETEWHERVENFLAETFGFPSALLTNCGFMANLAVLGTLGSLEGVHFFSDQYNHASLIDGLRISGAPKSVFRHNDMGHLEELVNATPAKLRVIVTESVFSMDGDLAPLDALISLCHRHGAWLVVDEAHATGVFGRKSLGRIHDFPSVVDLPIIVIHTGGKALGGQGAFVLSSLKFRELLINRARSFIYTTALSPLLALQLEFAIHHIVENPLLSEDVLDKASTFRKQLSNLGYRIHGDSQIIAVILGSNEGALNAAQSLRQRGFDVRAIRSPTVPRGSERLRITIKSFHQTIEIQSLLFALQEEVER